nr:MAG TPA: hypothetical protein [Caudoviricetes sp.]
MRRGIFAVRFVACILRAVMNISPIETVFWSGSF